tara:strand:+ start:8021 stop:8941 length:921 start_codon:yes stop_codon:yes gene_type:complete
LKSSDIEFFKENGFLVKENPISLQSLEKARESFKKIVLKVKNGGYKYIRVYDDYSNSLNLAGIDILFHPEIIDQNIVNLLNESKIINYAKNILGENIKLTLSRYHLTEDVSHIGNWHRDALPNKELTSLQINLYLFNEKGIQILPKSHLKELSDENKLKISKSPFSSLKNSQLIETKETECLIFNPAIFHRGYSSNRRANMHFRFEKKETKNHSLCRLDVSKKEKYYSNLYFSNEWKRIIFLNESIIFENDLKEYLHSKKIKNKILRKIRFFIHHFIFFFPLNFYLYKKFNVRPNLKIREFFHINS